MCGIAGFLDVRRQSTCGPSPALTAIAMANTLAHRGPDGEGVWADADSGVALAHRRLAIIDLSPAGKQPMLSSSGRFVLTYNGEIYNARELAAELAAKGVVFKGHSDTEVILEGCVAWGVDRCIERLNGMFAFALWDRESRKLILVRDRFGIKPLYWANFGGCFLFGSELKAIRAHYAFAAELDRDAIAGFMRHGYIAAPRSVYQNVYKLEPGHILTIRADGNISSRCYWDVRRVASGHRPARPSPDLIDELHTLLNDAVRRCMISDVPLGAFLSGGIDSSVVVALMQENSTHPVRTFTIGFADARFNEAEHAKAVAGHLGTDHTELYVEDADLLRIVPKLSYYFDEPFADPSQIPTYLLANLTRRHVTVSLSGDGGDELFGGYARYFQTERLWAALGWIPSSVRHLMSKVADRIMDAGNGMDRQLANSPPMRDKLHKLSDFFREGNPLALYRQIQSDWPRPEALVLGAREPHGVYWDDGTGQQTPALLDLLRLIDSLSYLPDHVLTKTDRATMSAGLEGRVPLLDHRVAELAWSLPPGIHMGKNRGKLLLREVLNRYVPRALIERPKWGFMPPIGSWLRGPLREWASELLEESRLRDEGILNPLPVRARWRHHLGEKGRHDDWCSPLWNVLTLQAWLEAQKKPAQEVRINAPRVAAH